MTNISVSSLKFNWALTLPWNTRVLMLNEMKLEFKDATGCFILVLIWNFCFLDIAPPSVVLRKAKQLFNQNWNWMTAKRLTLDTDRRSDSMAATGRLTTVSLSDSLPGSRHWIPIPESSRSTNQVTQLPGNNICFQNPICFHCLVGCSILTLSISTRRTIPVTCHSAHPVHRVA